jgi:hypothetical protein
VRSHSTVVEPPGCQEHTTTCGWSRLAAGWRTWPRHGRPGRRAVRNFLTPSSARRRPMCDRDPIWEPDAIHLRTPIRTHSDAVRSGTALPDHLSDDVGRMVTNYRSEGLLRRGGASDDRIGAACPHRCPTLPPTHLGQIHPTCGAAACQLRTPVVAMRRTAC